MLTARFFQLIRYYLNSAVLGLFHDAHNWVLSLLSPLSSSFHFALRALNLSSVIFNSHPLQSFSCPVTFFSINWSFVFRLSFLASSKSLQPTCMASNPWPLCIHFSLVCQFFRLAKTLPFLNLFTLLKDILMCWWLANKSMVKLGAFLFLCRIHHPLRDSTIISRTKIPCT